MNGCLITFRSVTPAQRGEGALKRAGIDCTLQRTPRWMEEQGCGYCVKLNCALLPEALQLMQKNQIPYRKAYLSRPGGKLEEMHL